MSAITGQDMSRTTESMLLSDEPPAVELVNADGPSPENLVFMLFVNCWLIIGR